jgi:hypothetical protein
LIVFPRVNFLFQHLVSKPIIANMVLVAESAPVADKIQLTIAHLLSSISDERWHDLVQQDLIDMGADLSDLAASWDRGELSGKDQQQVFLILLAETVHHSGLPNDTEYSVPVRNREMVTILQAAVWGILHRYVSFRKHARVNTDSVMNQADSPSRHADIHFASVWRDPELFFLLLCQLRRLLEPSTSCEPRAIVFNSRSKTAAIMVVFRLIQDMKRRGADSVAQLLEIGLLLAAAMLEHCRVLFGDSKTTFNGSSAVQLSQQLAKSFRLLVFPPPRVHGSVSAKHAQRALFFELLPTLLDCMHWICPSDVNVTASSFSLVLLDALKQAFQEVLEAESSLYGFVMSRESVANIFSLIVDPELGNSAVGVVLQLLAFGDVAYENLIDWSLLKSLSKVATTDFESLRLPSFSISEDQHCGGEELTAAAGTKRKPSSIESLRARSRIHLEKSLGKIRRIEQMTVCSRHSVKASDSCSVLEELSRVLCSATHCVSRLARLLQTHEHIHYSKETAQLDASSIMEIMLAPALQGIVILASLLAQRPSHFQAFDKDEPNGRALRLLATFIETAGLAGRHFFSKSRASDKYDRRIGELFFRCSTQLNILISRRSLPASLNGSFKAFVNIGLDLSDCLLLSDDEAMYIGAEAHCDVIRTAPVPEPISVQYFECPPGAVPIALDIQSTYSSHSQIRRIACLRWKYIGGVVAAGGDDVPLVRLSIETIRQIDCKQTKSAPRLLLWQTVAWLFLNASRDELDTLLTNRRSIEDSEFYGYVRWMVESAFADRSAFIRNYVSREIGTLFSGKSLGKILVAFASGNESQTIGLEAMLDSDVQCRTTVVAVSDRLFKMIDEVLHEFCYSPQSTFSCSATTSQEPRVSNAGASALHGLRCSQKLALRTLLSICDHVDSKSIAGRFIYEYSFMRIVRLWSSVSRRPQGITKGLSYGEMACFRKRGPVGTLVPNECFGALIPSIVRDVLVVSTEYCGRLPKQGFEGIPPKMIEFQYFLLETFFENLLNRDREDGALEVTRTGGILESILPTIISQFVAEMNYDALRLVAGFRIFIQARKRKFEKITMRNGSIGVLPRFHRDSVIEDMFSFASKSTRTRQWARNLGDHARNMCLTSFLIERTLPLIFFKAGKAELVFFIKTALQNTITLKKLLSSREQLILKGLICELTKDSELRSAAGRVLRTAAIARSQERSGAPSLIVSNESQISTTLNFRDSAGYHREATAAIYWVTSHFMYLLVNAVQHRWGFRSINERVHAMHCLTFMLENLQASDAAQYFPQILTSVNAAMTQRLEPAMDKKERKGTLELHFLAVHVLSLFTKRIAESNPMFLGQNLTTVVVSLIPILSSSLFPSFLVDGAEQKIAQGSLNAAVGMLEEFTTGELGKHLAPFFRKIPFLPPCAALDSVRVALKGLGVDFDNLHVVSVQSPQQDGQWRGSLTSDIGSGSVDSASTACNSRRQLALRQRLEMICSLLGNENASIRRVVLEHLTSLLKANRELFHRLLENESFSSMKRYITVAYSCTKGKRSELLSESVFQILSDGVYFTRFVQRSNY